MDNKLIILRLLVNKKCTCKKKGKLSTYKLNAMKVIVDNRVANKIDKLIKQKKYNLLRNFIDIYDHMFTTNFS